MIEKKSGVIIHIASIQGRLPLYKSTLPYAAAKAGLINYSKNLSNEVSPKGVRVLTVSPGWLQTTSAIKMVERLAESSRTTFEESQQKLLNDLDGLPKGRPAIPQEETALAGLLDSHTAAYFVSTV